ncbi:MAG TPA: hypothetical protein VI248_23090, partial [Kineosporiaceae bacterium]
PWSPWHGAPGESAWDHWSVEVDLAHPGPGHRPPVGVSATRSGTGGRGIAHPGAAGNDGAGNDGEERTRNGLRKRTPRSRRPTPPTDPGPDRDAARPDVVDDSPDQIRARLTSLRSGMQRAQGMPVDTATPSWPAPTCAQEDE